MAVAHIVEPLPPAGQPPRKRWTRAECEKLELFGLLDAQRYELIDGELIDKRGKNRPHTVVCMLLMRWLSRTDQPTSEPQPDVVLLTKPVEHYRQVHPTPSEVQLLIEVADTSLDFDTGTKARLYARSGVTDYWVVDINSRSILVFREPLRGVYQLITKYEAQEKVSPLTAPDAQLCLNDLLPAGN